MNASIGWNFARGMVLLFQPSHPASSSSSRRFTCSDTCAAPAPGRRGFSSTKALSPFITTTGISGRAWRSSPGEIVMRRSQ
jgi:hypothetical protein